MTRLALGFLLAPLLPAVIAILVNPVLQPLMPADSPFGFLVVATIFSPWLAVPATVLFALPLFGLFHVYGWVALRHALVGGALVGVATTVVFALYGFFNAPNPYHWSEGRLFIQWRALIEPAYYAALFVPYGVVMAWIFWLVAYWKRKPNHTPNADARESGARRLA